MFWNPELQMDELYDALQNTVTAADTLSSDISNNSHELSYLLGAVDAVRLLGYLREVPEVELYHLLLRQHTRKTEPFSLLKYCREKAEVINGAS